MPDTGRRDPPGSNNALSGNDGRKPAQHSPDLTQEVAQAGIPVLQQEVTGNALEDSIPALDQTLTMFEKNVPVLDETADPSALTSDVPADA